MSPSPDYGTTTRFGLRYCIGDTLISDLDTVTQAMAGDVDTKMVGLVEGLLSARPTAGYSNRLFRATDTNQVFYDNGTAWVELIGGSSAPIGTVSNYAGAADPNANWMITDGRSLLRSSYPTLFTLIGVTYGSVDGTHFSIPDCRSRVVVGAGAGPGLTARTLAAQFGEENHALSVGELAAHAHTLNDPGHNHSLNNPGHSHGATAGIQTSGVQYTSPSSGVLFSSFSQQRYSNPGYNAADGFDQSDHSHTITISAAGAGVSANAAGTGQSVNASGSGTAHNNVQPSIALNKIIRVL